MCVPYTFFHACHLLSAIRLWFDNFMDYGQILGRLYGFTILMFFVRKRVQSFCVVNRRWPEMELFVEKLKLLVLSGHWPGWVGEDIEDQDRARATPSLPAAQQKHLFFASLTTTIWQIVITTMMTTITSWMIKR